MSAALAATFGYVVRGVVCAALAAAAVAVVGPLVLILPHVVRGRVWRRRYRRRVRPSRLTNGYNYSIVRTPRGRVVGVWFENESHAKDGGLLMAVLAGHNLLHLVGARWVVSSKGFDDRGGAFVRFGDLAPGNAFRGAARPPLPEPYEGLAIRLTALVPDWIAGYGDLKPDQQEQIRNSNIDRIISNRTQPEDWLRDVVEIRAIGHRLDSEGGFELMVSVAERAETLSPWRILRNIEWRWDGIGDWMG